MVYILITHLAVLEVFGLLQRKLVAIRVDRKSDVRRFSVDFFSFR